MRLGLSLLLSVHARVEDSTLLSCGMEGLVRPVSEPRNGIIYSTNILIDTGSQVSSIRKSAFTKDQLVELSEQLEGMAPSRKDAFVPTVDEGLALLYQGVYALGGESSLGRTRFGLLPLTPGMTRFIDSPSRIYMKSKCALAHFPKMSVDRELLKNRGEWAIRGTVSVEDDFQMVQMVIRTGGTGIELPKSLYEKYVASLERRGYSLIPAEGRFEGFLLCIGCWGLEQRHVPNIMFTSLPVHAIPDFREYSVPVEKGVIIGVKSSGNDQSISFGSVLVKRIAMLFDYPNSRLYMCNIPA